MSDRHTPSRRELIAGAAVLAAAAPGLLHAAPPASPSLKGRTVLITGASSGFGRIGEGDVDWPEVRKALRDIRFTGWATAEVKGGDRDHCAGILADMRKHLLGIA